MARFRYQALDQQGRKVSGAIEAVRESAAVAALRARSIFVLDLAIEGTRANPRHNLDHDPKSVPATHLAIFLRELALMLRSGVTLLHALESCATRGSHARIKMLAATFAEKIRRGERLSQAMAHETRAFSQLAVRLIESAEASGEMDAVLERIADVVERRTALKRQLTASLSYPAIVFFVAVGVAAFLVLGIVPRFARFFSRRDIPMPWTTQALMDFSAWLHGALVYLIAGVVVLAFLFVVLLMTSRGRHMIDRVKLALPIVGPLLVSASVSHLAWTLGALLRSGVGLLSSLRIAASVLGNRALARHIENSTERVLGGQSLSTAVEHRAVPNLVPSVISAGEQSGALTEALDGLASFYANDLALRLKRMSSLVEPVLVLIIGGMVAFVYLAFFQALIQLSSR